MSPRPGGRRRGFSVVELALSGCLMVVLGVILGRAWLAFGRPAIASMARARLAQEANLAAEALSRDVGMLAAQAGDWRYANAVPAGGSLAMTVDDGTGPREVAYALIDGKLVRTDPDGPRAVASLVADFQSYRALGPDGRAPGVQVDLTLSHRTHDRDRDGSFRADHTRRYTLFLPDAPS